MLRKSVLGTAGLLVLAAAAGVHGCSPEDLDAKSASQSGDVGEVGLSLTLPSGTVINTVNYTITGGPAGGTRSAPVNVTNSTLLKFRVGDLPVGPGYTMVLAATTVAGQSCASSAAFDISNNGATTLTMTLVCGGGTTTGTDGNGDIEVNATVTEGAGVTCPVVTGISALPLEILTNNKLSMTGSVTSTTGVTYAWTGTGGAFSASNTAATDFTCMTPGDQTLTFAITKAGCAPSSMPVTITCTTPSAYVIPVAPGVTTKAIMSVGESFNNKPDGTPYRMVGIPDGLGTIDNGDGTFTLLMNQEISAPGTNAGITRAHGGVGAFVSKWIIRKSDLKVLSGSDLIQTVNLWNPTTSAYQPGPNTVFGRFCSADLAPKSAFYNTTTSTGFNGQLFLNGEEIGNEGRALAHGTDGVSYELPRLGKASWENSLASPFAQDKTIVMLDDDSTPGEVYMYVGTKTNSGLSIDRAGLTNGNLYGVAVTGFAAEPQAGGIPSAPFTLVNHGNVQNSTGAALQTLSTAGNVTKFNRPEDGAWDPMHPSDYYFVTTNGITSPSRLWRLRFSNIATPETGGALEMLLDGTEGQVMFDNIAIDARGHIMLLEDPGNDSRIARVYRYDIATDALTFVAQHNPALYTTGSAQFVTQDEETSGVIDATNLLGAGWWLLDNQTHVTLGGELAEGGQLIALFDPASAL